MCYDNNTSKEKSDGGKQPFRVEPCKLCGAERKYEFQVLPTSLYYLEEDDGHRHAIDFGTIVVYTCSASCNLRQNNVSYSEEVAFVQPPMAFDLKFDTDAKPPSNASS